MEELLENISIAGGTFLVALAGFSLQWVQKQKQDNQVTRSLVREDIRKIYFDVLKRGYITEMELDNIHELYEAYKQAKGNSYIHHLVEYIDKNVEVRAKDENENELPANARHMRQHLE